MDNSFLKERNSNVSKCSWKEIRVWIDKAVWTEGSRGDLGWRQLNHDTRCSGRPIIRTDRATSASGDHDHDRGKESESRNRSFIPCCRLTERGRDWHGWLLISRNGHRWIAFVRVWAETITTGSVNGNWQPTSHVIEEVMLNTMKHVVNECPVRSLWRRLAK